MSAETPRKTERIMAWITPALKAHLEQVLVERRKQDKTTTMADVVREGLRTFLDQQEEIMGSRAHQVRTFQKQADRIVEHVTGLEERIILLEAVTLHLLAIVSAIQLKALQGKEVDPQRLMDLALKSAVGERGLSFLDELFRVAEALGRE